jgi:hypothetical protein
MARWSARQPSLRAPGHAQQPHHIVAFGAGTARSAGRRTASPRRRRVRAMSRPSIRHDSRRCPGSSVIDLLEDPSSDALVEWMAHHPGSKVICRDRDGVYASAAWRTGCRTSGRPVASHSQPGRCARTVCRPFPGEPKEDLTIVERRRSAAELRGTTATTWFIIRSSHGRTAATRRFITCSNRDSPQAPSHASSSSTARRCDGSCSRTRQPPYFDPAVHE